MGDEELSPDSDPAAKGYIVDGRYRLLETLGQGAFGVVWAAEHVATRQPVALKIAHVRFSGDATSLERFRREAKALEVIDHPGIVSVIDVGTHEGRAFVAMERLHGRSMLDAFKDPATTDEMRLDALEDLLAPLAAAHRQGFVHRDLKPENVFLTEDGLRVLDFGLTKQAEVCGVTVSGTTLGTPQYMSPEQAADSKHVGPSADVWAVGVMLHQVFAAGALPYPGENAGAILHKLAHDPPAPLPDDVPPAWRALIGWCLERASEDRPADAVMLQYAFVEARQSPEGDAATFRERVRRSSGAPVDVFAPTGMMPEQAVPEVLAASAAPSSPSSPSSEPEQSAVLAQGTVELPVRRPGRGLVLVGLLAAAGLSAAGMFFLFAHLDDADADESAEAGPVADVPAELPPEPAEEALVRVEITTDLQDVHLYVDDLDRGPLPPHAAIRLRPARHVFEARRGDEVLASATLELAPDEDAHLTLDAGDTHVEHVAVPAEERTRRTSSTAMEGALAVLPPERDEPQPGPSATGPSATPAEEAPAAMTAAAAPGEPGAPTNEPAPGETGEAEPMRSPFVEPAGEPAPRMLEVVDHTRSMAATAPPRTAPPTAAEMRRVLAEQLPHVRRCVGSWDGDLDVAVTWLPDGTPRARVGRGPPSQARVCVQSALHQHARLPAFQGGRAAQRHTYELER